MSARKRKSGAKRNRRVEPELTISVPEAGRRYLGIGKNAAYEAAQRGEIPTIRIGQKILRVPVRAMERLLDQAISTVAAE